MPNLCTGRTSADRAVPTTARSVLQLAAPANGTPAPILVEVTFDGRTANAPKVLVEVIRYATPLTTSDSGWSDTAEVTVSASDTETPLGTVIESSGSTAEPASPLVIHREWTHPQANFSWRPPQAPNTTVKGGAAWGVRLSTASSLCNYRASIKWIE